MTLTPEIAELLDRVIIDEQLADERTFHPPRPRTQILEMVIRLGLEFYRARKRLTENLPSSPKPSGSSHKQGYLVTTEEGR